MPRVFFYNNTENDFLRIILLFCVIMIFVSCGLDNIIYLTAPKYTRLTESTQENEQYIEFETTDIENSSSIYYTGFQILYKIYDTTDNLKNAVSDIQNYNKENPQNAVRYLLENKKYQFLLRDDKKTPLVSKDVRNRKVRVRLYDYGTSAIEKSGLYIDMMHQVKVIRFDESEFKVLDGNDSSTDIAKVDNAIKYLYVVFFATTVGFDSQFINLYSELLYLGFLTLKE